MESVNMSNSRRYVDFWAFLLFIVIFMITYIRVISLFSMNQLQYKDISVVMYLKNYFIIVSCITTVFYTMIFSYLSAPKFTTVICTIIIPALSLCRMLLTDSKGQFIRKYSDFKNILRVVFLIALIILLVLIFVLYTYKKISYNRFMISRGLAYAKINASQVYKLYGFFILKICILLITMNLVEELLKANGKKSLLKSIFPSLLSLGTVIGSVKVITSLLMIHEIRSRESHKYKPNALFMIIPTLYANSFLCVLNLFASCFRPFEHSQGGFKAWYNTTIKFLYRWSFGLLCQRSDFVMYYSFLSGCSYFPALRNSAPYLKRKNIAKMMSEKVVYLTFLPLLLCLSLTFPYVIDALNTSDKSPSVIAGSVISIALIEVLNSRFEFLIFLYADRPELLNDNDEKLFKTFLEISKATNENSSVIVNIKDVRIEEKNGECI